MRDDEQFDARRTDPRALYERTGFFGGPKRKFKLSAVCLVLALSFGAAVEKLNLSHPITEVTGAVSGLFLAASMFLAWWSSGEDWTLRR